MESLVREGKTGQEGVGNAAPDEPRWWRLATLLACGCATAGLLAMGAAQSLVPFALGLCLAGGSAGLVSPGIAQSIGDSVGERQRAQA